MILPEKAIEAVTPQRNNKTFALAILKQKNAHSLNFGQSFYVKGGEGRDNFVNLKNELRNKVLNNGNFHGVFLFYKSKNLSL